MSKPSILIDTWCYYPEKFKINYVALSWINKGYEVDVLTLVPTCQLVTMNFLKNFRNTYKMESALRYLMGKIMVKTLFKQGC